MAEVRANSDVKQLALNAVVTRCMCGGGPGAHDGKPCPHGIQENLGSVGYWSHKPIQRTLYRLRRWLNCQHVHWHR